MSKGKLEQAKADEILGRITTTLEFSDLAEVDLVVEAVAEDLETKVDDLQGARRAP